MVIVICLCFAIAGCSNKKKTTEDSLVTSSDNGSESEVDTENIVEDILSETEEPEEDEDIVEASPEPTVEPGREWASTTNKVSASRCIGKEAFHPFDTYEDFGVETPLYNPLVQYSVNLPVEIDYMSAGGFTVIEPGTRIMTIACNFFTDPAHYKLMNVGITNADSIKEHMDKMKSTDNILETMSRIAMRTIKYGFVDKAIESLSVDKKENVVINDWKMTRYEGIATVDEESVKAFKMKNNKLKYVAYTVIKEGIPIYLLCLDSSEEQKSSAILSEYAEKVAHTFKHWNFSDEDSSYDGCFFD